MAGKMERGDTRELLVFAHQCFVSGVMLRRMTRFLFAAGLISPQK